MALKKTAAKPTAIEVPALQLQETPPVYVVVIPGRWLLQHTTPSWRLQDPMLGFQRIVKEDRAKQIARTILDRERAFPNAITLATDARTFTFSENKISIPNRAKFLVVDGQHRLWAQKFSIKDGHYACIIHLNKSEKDMAELFLEINENQKRVPSSLRWDLVRLVRPEGDEAAITASEIVFALVERDDSPFHISISSAEDVKEQDARDKEVRKKQGHQASIDLTGEQKELSIKQGSLAPEIKTLVGRVKKKHNPTFDDYVALLIRFFSAVRSLNPTAGEIPQAPTIARGYFARSYASLQKWPLKPRHWTA